MNVIELTKYISNKIDELNKRFPNLISNIQKENYIKSNINIEMTENEIRKKVKEVDNLYDEIIIEQERLLEMNQNLTKELQKKKEQLKNVDKSFGEVYKSYVIHIFKIFEEIINDEGISDKIKKQVFESRLKEYLFSENTRMNKYLLEQIKDSKRIKNAQFEMFLGSESLNYESVSNLYKTFIDDINLVANDFEGKMYFTVVNNKKLEFDSEGNLITKIDYNFEGIKEIYDFAKKHNKKVKFHTFLWHNAIPENLKFAIDSTYDLTLKRNMALSFLEDYAFNLAKFINKNGYNLKQIEVLNEIASDKLDHNILRDSWWKDVIGKNPINGDEYFIDVLKIVRKEFPNVELTYNDYNEYLPYKCDKMCKIVEYIKEVQSRDKVVLLDGLGLQAHYSDYIKKMKTYLTSDMIKETALKFMKLDIPLYITEFDFNVIKNRNADELKQSFIDYYVSVSNGLNMWGNSDNLTWKFTMLDGKFLNSHMIDTNGVPKEIYYQIMQKMGL